MQSDWLSYHHTSTLSVIAVLSSMVPRCLQNFEVFLVFPKWKIVLVDSDYCPIKYYLLVYGKSINNCSFNTIL